MTPHAPTAIAACLLCLLCQAAGAQAQTDPPADNCAAIQQQIAERYRAGGVPNAMLGVVAASDPAGARVVGSCGRGSRHIVYRGPGPASAAARPVATAVTAATAATATTAAPNTPDISALAPARDHIPTECKDGSIVIGPNCADPGAVRMTSADIAAASATLATNAAPAASASASASALPATQPASR